jgi:Uma2 family endonuclease
MNIRTTLPMDKATFYRWLERQERRHELVDGKPRMLPYVTSNHARICRNLIGILISLLDEDTFDISWGDYALETGERSVRFADILVYPFEPEAEARRALDAPLVIEVLSDSTQHIDFGTKLTEYQAMGGVRHYVVCAQRAPFVWSWQRGEEGAWPDEPVIIDDLAAAVEIPGLGILLPMARIYRKVTLPGPKTGK